MGAFVEWLKTKLVVHFSMPLLNRRVPGRPWRPLKGFRAGSVSDDRTRLDILFDNGRLEIAAVAPRILRLIIAFDSFRKTPCFNGEYFTYAVATEAALPLAVKEDDGRITASAAEEGGPSISIDKATARIEARDEARLLFSQPRAAASAGDWVSFVASQDRPVRFLGFGEKTGGLFKNGRSYVMWNTNFADMGKNSDPLYQTCPLVITLDEAGSAHGLFFDNPHYARFRMSQRGRPGRLRYDARRGPLTLYLLAGPSLQEVVRQFTELTGRFRLPPFWSLGHHHSRWEPEENAERALAIVRGFRERGIPLDALHIDIGHMRGFRCFTWHPERFPDPKAFVETLCALEVHPVVITDPGLKKDEDWDIFVEGKAKGYFLKRPSGAVASGPVWPGGSAFPDFSQSAAARWWGGLFRAHTENRIDGFWVDMNEPSVFDARGTLPDNVVHRVEPEDRLVPEGADGSLRQRDHASLHNYYGFLMAKATAEGLARLRPGLRTFLFTRSAYAGVQRFASSWTGDIRSDWAHLRMSLSMAMNMGLSGQLMTGPDIGGFIGAPTPELLVRFFQAATFFPFHRNHTADNTPPQELWHFGKGIEAIGAEHIRLRYAYLPYLYTAFRQGELTGDPVCRPLCYDFPGEPACLESAIADSEYLCGGRILVTPALKRGQTEREVYFPGGPDTWWICGRTHAARQGGGRETVPAPLDRLPFFVKRGSVIPVILPAAGGFVSTAGYFDQELCFDIFPAPEFSGELYLDDGMSLDYQQGAFSLLAVSGRETAGGFSISIERTGGSLMPCFHRFKAMRIRLARFGKKTMPTTRVTANGRALEPEGIGVDGDWLSFRLPVLEPPVRIEVIWEDRPPSI